MEKGANTHSEAKCVFGKLHGLEQSCPIKNPPPPKEILCAPPAMLDKSIWNFNNDRDELTKQPSDIDWEMLIPEVSDISETTSRLCVWDNEGDWKLPDYTSIAWDMTGYLFDKIQGAPWVRDSDILKEEDWHFITGPKEEENQIKNMLFVDRLPDRLAIQTPPTAILVAYLNRLWAYHWMLLSDTVAPTPWLLIHGYPSYIDWPPAWHWNLGIRMLSSLAEYLASQARGFMGPGPRAYLPDLKQQISTDLRIPFIRTDSRNVLLQKSNKNESGPSEMDWDYFPGIVPFVPGADSTQLAWFGKKILKMGFHYMAIDAVNSIAHETFRGIPEAVETLLSNGTKHVFVYGPWPLHPPSKYVPINNVTYIPNANHIDMTNRPSRYWLAKSDTSSWKSLPSYKRTGLKQVTNLDDVGICRCAACESAIKKETSPQSIWRWGHMLIAGKTWEKRIQSRRSQSKLNKKNDTPNRLWFQGPSYAVFRKCLHYPAQVRWKGIDDVLESLVFDETKMTIHLTDGSIHSAEAIRWTWFDEMHEWADGFPKLED